MPDPAPIPAPEPAPAPMAAPAPAPEPEPEPAPTFKSSRIHTREARHTSRGVTGHGAVKARYETLILSAAPGEGPASIRRPPSKVSSHARRFSGSVNTKRSVV